MSNDAHLRFEFGREPPGRRAGAGVLRALVVDDFGGKAARSGTPEGPFPVDLERWEARFARHGVELELAVEGATTPLAFRDLEDFHPDSLYRREALFGELSALRTALRDPRTFEAAAAKLREGGGAQARPTELPGTQGAATPRGEESDQEAVQRLLGGQAPPERPAPDALDRLMRQAVAPFVVPAASAGAEVYVREVESRITARMRALLHHEAFQALESAWRQLYQVVDTFAALEDAEVHACDLGREQFFDALLDGAAEPGEALFGASVPWSLLVIGHEFGATARDLEALQALGRLASQHGVCVLAGVREELCAAVGGESGEEDAAPLRATWRALRASPAAGRIGLCLPRVLVRAPYGANSDPIESYAFEEFEPGDAAPRLLWGSAAQTCARLIAESVALEDGAPWPLELQDLPMHVLTDPDGEQRLAPCTERALSERNANALLEAGFMPLLALRDRNAIRLPDPRVLAASGAALPVTRVD